MICLDVKTAAGTRPSCSIGVWWSGGFQLLVYSLTPAPTTGKEHGRMQNQASAQSSLLLFTVHIFKITMKSHSFVHSSLRTHVFVVKLLFRNEDSILK